MKLSAKQLIGAWVLREWRIEYPQNMVRHPFGADAIGQLLYTHDGQMSATVSADKRPAQHQGNPRQLGENQKAQAFDSYFHYAGSWSIESDIVIHRVDFSLNPDFIGSIQRRRARLINGRQLTLSAEETTADKGPRQHILEWLKTDL